MVNKFTPEDKKQIRDFLDDKHGPYMRIEDILHYLFIRYVWKDQVSEYSLLGFGKPLPPTHNISFEELDRATPDERTAKLERLIYIYICESEYNEVYVEALRRLLTAHLEHDIEVPGVLQAWAYKVALIYVPKYSRGNPGTPIEDHRAHLAYKYIKQKYGYSDLSICGVIAETKAELQGTEDESEDTVKSAIDRAKKRTKRLFDKRNRPKKLVKNSRH